MRQKQENPSLFIHKLNKQFPRDGIQSTSFNLVTISLARVKSDLHELTFLNILIAWWQLVADDKTRLHFLNFFRKVR